MNIRIYRYECRRRGQSPIYSVNTKYQLSFNHYYNTDTHIFLYMNEEFVPIKKNGDFLLTLQTPALIMEEYR